MNDFLPPRVFVLLPCTRCGAHLTPSWRCKRCMDGAKTAGVVELHQEARRKLTAKQAA